MPATRTIAHARDLKMWWSDTELCKGIGVGYEMLLGIHNFEVCLMDALVCNQA